MQNEKNVNYGNWKSTQKDETLPIPEGQNYSNEPESIDENYDNTLNEQNDEMSEISNFEFENDGMSGYGKTEQDCHTNGEKNCHTSEAQDCHTNGARDCHTNGEKDCHENNTQDCK